MAGWGMVLGWVLLGVCALLILSLILTVVRS